MILVVDIGNTTTKLAQFENNSIVTIHRVATEKFQENFLHFFPDIPPQTPVVLASVADNHNQIYHWLKQRVHVFKIDHQTPMPFTNLYATPKTLGIDRMVLAAGAAIFYKNQNCLIIDAGTCVTYEFLDSNNNYLGGAISPGLQMRYKALNHYTAKLPELEPQQIDYLIGKTTNESIHSGVIHGICNEIDAMIEQYKKSSPDLTIILTGGDTLFLAKRLKNVIFANSNFLLESLNALYQYTIENDKKNSSKS
ncbi:type III pantothenate kinase [Myroides sp. LJL119]